MILTFCMKLLYLKSEGVIHESSNLTKKQACNKKWRTQLQPIRTAAEITAQIKIYPVRRVYMYQKYSQKAKELRLLGMSYQQIAYSLNVSKKTVISAYKHK